MLYRSLASLVLLLHVAFIVFRRAAGGTGYSVDFIERYSVQLVYPAELSRSLQLVLGTIVVVTNVVVYGLALRLPRR